MQEGDTGAGRWPRALTRLGPGLPALPVPLLSLPRWLLQLSWGNKDKGDKDTEEGLAAPPPLPPVKKNPWGREADGAGGWKNASGDPLMPVGTKPGQPRHAISEPSGTGG